MRILHAVVMIQEVYLIRIRQLDHKLFKLCVSDIHTCLTGGKEMKGKELKGGNK